MLNRRQAIVGALVLVAATFTLTTAAFLYFVQLVSGDAAATLKFFRALQVVHSRYIEDVPVSTLMEGAVRGMVRSMGDPHSIYFDGKMFKEFQVETEGAFGGIGVVVGMKDNLLTVISPVEGTPGEQAGIKSGDQILKIDGEDIKSLALDEAVAKIRGPKGTQVELTLRNAKGETRTVSLTRSTIQLKTVAGKMLREDVGLIRIAMFNEHTGDDFVKKLNELEAAGMKSLVLDLRDNPGGLLDQAVIVSRHLVPKGPIVSVVMKDGSRETHTSSLEKTKFPLVVLVNQGSASASEIVAGAVQDTQAGTLVGTKTYGKGSVQTVIRMDSDTAIKLTIAKYLTPAGRSINGIGIEPDVVLPLDEEVDNQLERAIELAVDAQQ